MLDNSHILLFTIKTNSEYHEIRKRSNQNHYPSLNLLMFQLVSKYRITAILKVETDINTNIATGPIGRSVILMIMYVEVVKREDVYLIMLKLRPYCVTYQNRQNCKNLNILSSLLYVYSLLSDHSNRKCGHFIWKTTCWSFLTWMHGYSIQFWKVNIRNISAKYCMVWCRRLKYKRRLKSRYCSIECRIACTEWW